MTLVSVLNCEKKRHIKYHITHQVNMSCNTGTLVMSEWKSISYIDTYIPTSCHPHAAVSVFCFSNPEQNGE